MELTRDWFWIGGARRPGAPSMTMLDVIYPVTEQVIGRAAMAGPEDMDAAAHSAREAFDVGPWPQTPAPERAAVLRRAAEILTSRVEQVAEVLTRETGLPGGLGAAHASVSLLSLYADLAEHWAFEEERAGVFGGRALVRQVPVGVVAAIAPWNAPLFLSLNKVAPALAAGCTVVLKPAPQTPFDAYLLATALDEAGLPAGCFNVVPADRETGEALVRHAFVDKVAFTGSTAAGRRIGSICGEQLKRVTLELGGKSAALLLDDVDLEAALPVLVAGGMLNSGQACAALTRILVPRNRHDEVVDALADAVRALVVGDPFDPATAIGPMISAAQRERVEFYLELAGKEGARTVVGGGRPAGFTKGFFVQPTVLTDVRNDMRIAREEIFGPVLSVIAYDGSDAEAVRLANDSEYGLGGAVFTTDPARGIHVARRIRTGTVGVNSLGMDPAFPFGGFKASGVGRELGIEGLRSYLEAQTVGLA